VNPRNSWWLLVFIGVFVFASSLFAEIVAEVGVDGTLTMEDGTRVSLAGIQMDTEGISVLRVLVRKQDLKIQIIAPTAPQTTKFVYAFLNTKCLKFPAKAHEIPGEQEILLNEFLVKIGAAKVDEKQDFSRKSKFLKVQESARKKGEGVWSYEVP